MIPQEPAEGILMHRSYGDARLYTVACECGGGDHDQQIWIEADDAGVTVNTSTTQKTDWWTEHIEKRYDIDDDVMQWYDWFWKNVWNSFYRKVKLTWNIWFSGYVTYEANLMMTEQQALNYAETIKKAIADVKEFRQASKQKSST